MSGKRIVFFAITGLLLIYLLIINHLTWPRWIATIYDPSYPYLFNAFDWYQGKDLLMWGHPGMIMHYIFQMFVQVYSVLFSIEPSDFINQIDLFLYSGSTFIILIFCAALLFSGKVIAKEYSANHALIFVIGMITTININQLAHTTPESTVVMLSPLFVTSLLLFIKQNRPDRYIYVVALISASMLAAKYTTVFLVASSLLIVPFRLWFKYSLSIVVFFVLLMFPVWEKLPDSILWVKSIISQPGFGYGLDPNEGSAKGISYFGDFALKNLLYDKPWLLLNSLIIGLLLFYRKVHLSKLQILQITGLILLLATGFSVAVYKEMFRYFIPTKYISVILLFLVFTHVERFQSNRIQKIILYLLLGILSLSFVYLIRAQKAQLNRFDEMMVFSLNVEDFVGSEDAAVIRMFTTSSPEFAIFFGSYFSHGNYIEEENDYYLMPYAEKYVVNLNKWVLLNGREEIISILDIFEKEYERIYIVTRRTSVETPFWSDNKLLNFDKVADHEGVEVYEITLKESSKSE